jgi:ABC-type maltose transport system permease subunit
VRRLFGTGLALLLLLAFPLAPYAWMVVTSLKPAAYPFSRFCFAGRRLLLVQLLLVNMLPIVL